MKLYYRGNMNIKKDLKEFVIDSVFGTEDFSSVVKIEDLESEQCYEITGHEDVMKNKPGYSDMLKTFLAIRLDCKQISYFDIEGFEPANEEDIKLFFSTTFVKACTSKKMVEDYRRDVLTAVNPDISADVLSEDTTAEYPRFDKEGNFILDIICFNLDKRDVATLKSMARSFNRYNRWDDTKTTVIQPKCIAASHYADKSARILVGTAGEIAGNVGAVLVNATSECAKSIAYSFSRDLRVKEIWQDERAKSIKTNFKKNVWFKGSGSSGSNVL